MNKLSTYDLFSEQELERYADILLWGVETARQKAFQPDDIILIEAHMAAMPLVCVVHKLILLRGMHPIFRLIQTADMEADFYALANNKQLSFIAPGEQELLNHINGSIYIRAPEALTHLENIDPEKMNTVMRSHNVLKKIMNHRQQQKQSSWTLCAYPTAARAKHANLSLQAYADKIKKACYLDHPQSLSVWKDIYQQILETKKWLASLNIEKLFIKSKNIRLLLSIGNHRKWLGLSGRNIPSFEVFTSPDWRTVSGTYYSDQPVFLSGHYIKGIHLVLDKGYVINAQAETGEDFLNTRLNTDSGAVRVGEISLTDRRFSQIDCYMADILYDENYGGDHGNCHIAMGAAFETAYDGNSSDLSKEKKAELGFNDSIIHWDMVNTEPKTVTAILASGKEQIIYEEGQFKR
ncbi:MAG: aminopeptidase [Candidatus Magnetomorum sp.]|nr:aminopeptidase [Candidatus Magnetomorum sp.]